MKFTYTFDKHRDEPEKTFDSYVKERKVELGSWVNKRNKVYLDTKFWVLLRDVALSRAKFEQQYDLFYLLRSGVQKGVLICPISYAVFAEVIKQTDEVTLKATIKLIDELSLGVSLVSADERWKTEVLYFVRSCMQPNADVHDVKDFVWTKVAYTHGMKTPHNELSSEADNRLLQKAFFDGMWNLPLLDLLDIIGLERLLNYPHMPDFSDLMNQEKDSYQAENASFKKIFITELGYILKRCEADFNDMFLYLFKKEFGNSPQKDEVSSVKAGSKFGNIIYIAFKHGKVGTKLPTFELEAGIHAQLIFDRARRYKKNDIHDISHAIAAIPYCDCFLTEKNLREFVIRKNLGYDKKYNCIVVSSVKDAVAMIDNIYV